MWTKREKAIFREMGRMYLADLRYLDDLITEQDTNVECYNEELISLYDALTRNDALIIKTAVRAARQVKEPDWKGMWEHLKKVEEKAAQDVNENIRFYSLFLHKDLEYIERRHGGGKA